MSRPIPQHGTNARYKGRLDLPPCRCRRCTNAATRADAERRLDRLSGNARMATPELFNQVLKHLKYLLAKDMSQAQIAHAAEVHQTTISDLITGQRQGMTTKNAQKLLRVRPTDRTDTCLVPAVGTVRRLRALCWMRHRFLALEVETGIHHDSLLWLAKGRSARTTAAREEAIRLAYDRLAMTDGGSQQVREFAVENGWHGPLAWDDETIDDPNTMPVTDALAPIATEGENVADRWLHGESVILGAEDRRQVLQHLMEWTNDTPKEIAAQLEISLDTLWQTWSRIKKQARKEGRREPWRRVYVPRERNLTQTTMEEAA